MAIWKYTARIPGEKKKITKSIEAPTYADVYNSIVRNGWIPEEIKQVQSGGKVQRLSPLSLRETTVFCRQFSVMLSSGITISKSLDILKSQERDNKSAKLYRVYEAVYEDVQQGYSLYEAMNALNGIFPTLLVNLVKAGEVSGNLDTIMQRTADYFEKYSVMMAKVKSSMAYPQILIVMATVIMIGLFTFVLPQFFVVFEDLSVELPAITKLVVKMSDFIRNRWYILVTVVIGAVLAWNVAMTSPAIAFQVDYIKTKLPLVGTAVKKTAISNFTSTMGMLYSSGISMTDAIGIASTVLNNRYYESEFRYIVEAVSSGKLMSLALLESKIFEPMVSSMLYIGEETGNLDELLKKTSDFYENEANEAISKMVTALEPMILIVVGVMVLILVASVILPSFALATGIAEQY